VTPEKAHVESGQKRWQETVFGTGYTPTVDNGHVHGHAAALNGNVPAVRALDDVRDWTMGYASWEDGWVTADGDDCQGATPTSDKARRPTPTTSDRGRMWRLIGKEGSASKVLSGTYENVAEVGTGRVALSMQRLRQGGILRNDFNDFNDFNDSNDFNDFNLESLRLSLSDL